MSCGENDDIGVQKGLKKLAINDHDSASPETNSKDNDAQKKVTRGGKVKQTAQRKLVTPTPESSAEQMEGQISEGNIAGGNEEPEQATQGDETVTRKSPRTRIKTQNVGASATQTSKGTRSGKNPVSQPAPEPVPLPKNLLVPPIPKTNETAHQKEPRSEPTRPTTGNETTPASSSQPKDKGKAPVTEEAFEDDDEETEEEEDPEQYRLTRRRPGSSKITI
nr:nucleolar and coiled-body phosphoprotein 1-like [Coffea arabica]